MAMVNISITEYDALRNRAKELEQEKNEYKLKSEKLEKQLSDLPENRVVIKTSTSVQSARINWNKFNSKINYMISKGHCTPYELANNTNLLTSILSDVVEYKNLVPYEDPIKSHYVGFEDVRQEVYDKYKEELKENLRSEEEIRKDLESYFKSTIDSLKLDIQIKEEKHKEYVEKIVSTHMKSVEEYEKIIENLKEASLPTDQRLDKILKEHGFEVTTTWFGNLKLKKI